MPQMFRVFVVAALAGFVRVSSSSAVPSQVHIALAGSDESGNPNAMAVSWQTEENTVTSQVQYGLISGQYDQSATGTSSSCIPPSSSLLVWQWIRLWDLPPPRRLEFSSSKDNLFLYRGRFCGGILERVFFHLCAFVFNKCQKLYLCCVCWFRSRHLNSLPCPPLPPHPPTGLHMGDSTIAYLNRIQNEIDLIWHGGDVSYVSSSPGFATSLMIPRLMIPSFMLTVSLNFVMRMSGTITWTRSNQLSPASPTWLLLGTTKWSAMVFEINGISSLTSVDPACLVDPEKRTKLSNFTAYNTRFRMPSPESKGALNMHFSFNYGPVHFISIDTETGYPGAAEEVSCSLDFLFTIISPRRPAMSSLAVDLRINLDGFVMTWSKLIKIVLPDLGSLSKVIVQCTKASQSTLTSKLPWRKCSTSMVSISTFLATCILMKEITP